MHRIGARVGRLNSDQSVDDFHNFVFFKPPAPQGVYSIRVCPSVPSSSSYFLSFFLITLHHEFVTDWSEIFTEASFGDPNQHLPWTARSEPNSVRIGDRVTDLDQSVDDFRNFFSQMDTECDVDRKQTLSNIMRFPNPPNRRSGRPIRTNLLTIFIIFSARWTPNAMLTTNKHFLTSCDFRIH